MIYQVNPDAYDQVYKFISRDFARNYFIAMGLLKKSFHEIFLEEDENGIKAGLFLRKSGNLQFTGHSCDYKAFSKLIASLDYKTLICPKSNGIHFEGIELIHEGALIDQLNRDDYIAVESVAKKLQLNQVDEVENLYKSVFKGYPKADFMRHKLESHRGTAYYMGEDKILSVAQTDFYHVIVGVATDPIHQKKGLASQCLHAVIQEVFKDNKSAYLQYDNMAAGKIYRQLGFKNMDQVMHYRRLR